MASRLFKMFGVIMLPINEYKLRINFLVDFVDLYEKYLQKESPKLRNQISKKLGTLSFYAQESGVATHTNNPVRGDIDLFSNIFDAILANPQKVLDRIYCSIGNYELLHREWIRQIINPLCWIAQLIRLPFIVMHYAGINEQRIEGSSISIIYKVTMAFIYPLSAIASSLSYFEITYKALFSFLGSP